MTKRVITKEGEPIYYLEVSGNDFEIGKQIGSATACDINEMWEHFTLPRMVEWYGTPPDQYQSTYVWLRKNLETVCPWMVEQMDGIAEGSGLNIEKIWMMNHYPILWPSKGLFCSSMALKNSDAGPILAQNLDIGQEDLYYAIKVSPEHGHTTLSDAMCTMCWSPTGINDQGLAVGSSNLSCAARQVQKPLRGGMVNTFIPRMVLRQCGSTKEAVAFIQSLPDICPQRSGYQINIIDANGDMAVVDKTGPHVKVRQCADGMNFTTNYSLDEDIESWRMEGAEPEKSLNARLRAQRIHAEYQQQDGDSISLDWVKTLFHSHDGPDRLCRHGDEAGGSYSRLHMLYYPAERRLDITNGLPCQNEYRIFTL